MLSECWSLPSVMLEYSSVVNASSRGLTHIRCCPDAFSAINCSVCVYMCVYMNRGCNVAAIVYIDCGKKSDRGGV